jgi:DegV family protein with EDD domain
MVKIITDTTAVLPKDFVVNHQIPVIPQIINFEEESYYEGIDIDIPTFMQRLRSSEILPKTAAPPPELFVKEFKRLESSGEPILCIHPSSDVSGTVRSAIIAAKDFPQLDIRVIDTRTIASPVATLVKFAIEWTQQGLDINAIENNLRKMIPNCKVYFLVASLEYLIKGGRIGGASALIGNVLQIKPILCLNNGKVDVYGKERTHKRAIKRIIEITLDQLPSENTHTLSVMHADAYDQATKLAKELAQKLNTRDIPIYNMPPAIVTHGGPGILGVAFFVGKIP